MPTDSSPGCRGGASRLADPPGSVERLSAVVGAEAEAKHACLRRQIQHHIAAGDAFVTIHGSLAEEFSTL